MSQSMKWLMDFEIRKPAQRNSGLLARETTHTHTHTPHTFPHVAPYFDELKFISLLAQAVLTSCGTTVTDTHPSGSHVLQNRAQ